MASITDQNWVVWNQGKNPLVNFNFMLRVELMFDLPCKSVRAFSRELEYDFIQEGGLNDYVHMRRKPISKPFTLEVERYVGVDYVDPMPLGADLVLPVMLFVSRNHDQFIPFVVARTYVFTGCTVMKKTYGDLVADQSGLLVETTTLGYREMLCVDIPWSEVGDDISKDIKGNHAKPTDAKTQDKSADEYKALAQTLYEQAKTAKDNADTKFKKDEADKLLKELEDAITLLNQYAGPKGTLEKAVETAKANLNGPGGKTKRQIADELQQQVPPLRKVLDEKTAAWNKVNTIWEQAKKPLDELKRRKALLEPKAEEARKAAEEEWLNSPSRSAALALTPEELELNALTEEITALETSLAPKKTAMESAQKEMEAARQAWEDAVQKAADARDADSAAQRALSSAESDLKKGADQLRKLQNSKTNLTLRTQKAEKAQQNCGTQHDLCKTENDAVQKATDEQEVYNGYQSVRKLSKDTCYEERQVLEAVQYMTAARKQLTDAAPMIAAAKGPSGSQTSPGTSQNGPGVSPDQDGPGTSQNGPGVSPDQTGPGTSQNGPGVSPDQNGPGTSQNGPGVSPDQNGPGVTASP